VDLAVQNKMLVVGISAVLANKGKTVKKLFQLLDFIFI
jgi:hypothetical protein